MPKYKYDRHIDTLIAGAKWHIDFEWGLGQLSSYLHNVVVASQGTSLAELFAFERRKSALIELVAVSTPTGPAAITLQENEDPSGQPQENERYVAKYNLTGVMRLQGGACSWGVNDLVRAMNGMDGLDHIAGHFLEVDSGGGEGLAGDVLYEAVKGAEKPVYAYVHRAGSAAMHGIAAADRIGTSTDSSELGSIGTYYSINKQFVDWYKANIDDIYSSKSDDKNAAFRAYMKGDKSLLVASADKHVDVFHAHIESARPLNEDLKDSTLRGGMFPSAEAIERGLADEQQNYNGAMRSLVSIIENNTNQMDFQKAFAQLKAGVINVLGLTAEATDQEVLDQVAQAKPLADQIEAAVTARMGEMASRFEALEARISGADTGANTEQLEALTAKVTALEAEVSASKAELATEKAAWATEKASFEAQILDLGGTAPTQSNTTGDRDTLATFTGQLDKLELTGDAKY